MERLRVLFLCTGNSARSQIAEGILRKLSRGRADVFSAGASPELEVHPLALEVLRTRFNVDTADLFPKHLNRFHGDGSITYSPFATARRRRVRRSAETRNESTGFDDPVAVTGKEAQRRAFELVANGLAARLRIWMALPAVPYDLTLRRNGMRCVPDRYVTVPCRSSAASSHE